MSGLDRRKAREVLIDAWDDGNAVGLDGWAGEGAGRSSGIDGQAEIALARFLPSALDRLTKCVTPDSEQYRLGFEAGVASKWESAKITAVLALHLPEINDSWSCVVETCALDHEDWPCDTARACGLTS